MKATIQEKKSMSQNNIFLILNIQDFKKLGPYLYKVGFDLTKIEFGDWDIHGMDLCLPEDRKEHWGKITIGYDSLVHVSIGFPLNKNSEKYHQYFQEYFNKD